MKSRTAVRGQPPSGSHSRAGTQRDSLSVVRSHEINPFPPVRQLARELKRSAFDILVAVFCVLSFPLVIFVFFFL